MARCAKCGGAHKMKNGGQNPYPGKTMPLYSNNPRTTQGQQLKYGGSCGKGRVIRGGSLRRQKSN